MDARACGQLTLDKHVRESNGGRKGWSPNTVLSTEHQFGGMLYFFFIQLKKNNKNLKQSQSHTQSPNSKTSRKKQQKMSVILNQTGYSYKDYRKDRKHKEKNTSEDQEMAQSVKCSPHKPEDLCSIPRTPVKTRTKLGMAARGTRLQPQHGDKSCLKKQGECGARL